MQLCSARYCCLNELLFQNGKGLLNCGQGRGGSQAEYVVALYSHGAAVNPADLRDARVQARREVPSSKAMPSQISMMAHVNFCDNKQFELEARGLWLSYPANGTTFPASAGYFAAVGSSAVAQRLLEGGVGVQGRQVRVAVE